MRSTWGRITENLAQTLSESRKYGEPVPRNWYTATLLSWNWQFSSRIICSIQINATQTSILRVLYRDQPRRPIFVPRSRNIHSFGRNVSLNKKKQTMVCSRSEILLNLIIATFVAPPYKTRLHRQKDPWKDATNPYKSPKEWISFDCPAEWYVEAALVWASRKRIRSAGPLTFIRALRLTFVFKSKMNECFMVFSWRCVDLFDITLRHYLVASDFKATLFLQKSWEFVWKCTGDGGLFYKLNLSVFKQNSRFSEQNIVQKKSSWLNMVWICHGAILCITHKNVPFTQNFKPFRNWSRVFFIRIWILEIQQIASVVLRQLRTRPCL